MNHPRYRRALLAAALAIVVVPGRVASQETTPATQYPATLAGGFVLDTTVPAAAQLQPDGTFDPVAATQAYLGRLPAEYRERSDAYFEGRYWIALWSTLISAAVMLALLAFGWSRKLRDRVERISGRAAVQTFVYFAVFVVVTTLIFLPWNAYAEFLRERQYGLLHQSFDSWLVDQVKGLAIAIVLGGLAVTQLYAIVRRLPRTWPIWGAVAATVFMAFGALITPLYLVPIFNTVTPLTDERVREPVLGMARANLIDATDVYVVDASQRTRRISANVSGLLHTQRITLNDNLLERTTLPEIKSVMGHEIGHYVLNHIPKMLGAMMIVFVALFFALQRSFGWSVRRWGDRWGVRGIGDVAGLPLVIALATVFMFVLTPVTNTIIRTNEAEADAFGLNAAREPDGFALVALRLSEYRKLEPSRLEEALFYTHPSGRSRIYRAMVWKGEEVRRQAAGDGEAEPATSD